MSFPLLIIMATIAFLSGASTAVALIEWLQQINSPRMPAWTAVIGVIMSGTLIWVLAKGGAK